MQQLSLRLCSFFLSDDIHRDEKDCKPTCYRMSCTMLVLCVCYDIPFIKEYNNMINMYLPYYI